MTYDLTEIRARLADPLAVASMLGLRGVRRQQGGIIALCIAHDDRSPSLSLTLARSGELRARCFACSWSGDVFGLVAVARGLSTRTDFAAVVREAAELAGVEPERGARRMAPPPPDPIVTLAVRIQAAAIDLIDGRERPDALIETASIDSIMAALALLETADAAHRAETQHRDAELDRLAVAYAGEDDRRWDEALASTGRAA